MYHVKEEEVIYDMNSVGRLKFHERNIKKSENLFPITDAILPSPNF